MINVLIFKTKRERLIRKPVLINMIITGKYANKYNGYSRF